MFLNSKKSRISLKIFNIFVSLFILNLLYNFAPTNIAEAADERSGNCICRKSGQPDEIVLNIMSGGLETCQFETDGGAISTEDCPGGFLVFMPTGEGGTETITGGGDYGLLEAARDTGLSSTALSARVSTFIGAIVGFVGVIFLVLMIYGGLTWMTAGGNEEKVGKAKKIIVNSTIGIVIVMLSYAITYYIITTVAKAG